jgi:hypothetical protein
MSELERWVAELLRMRKLAANTTDPDARDELVRRAAEQAERIRGLIGRTAEGGCGA